MVQITVTSEIAKLIGDSLEPIELLDPSGHSIGYYVKPFSNAEIAEAQRRSKARSGGRTTDEALERLAQIDHQ